MPARKSDSRKSDVSPPTDVSTSNSNARFALKDDYQDPGALAAASSSTPAAAPTTSTSPPPTKMSASSKTQAQPEGDETEDEQPDKKPVDTGATTIEDLTLPKSIITRLAKGVLPANTQIQANAVLAMSKSTTVFVNYLASNANDHTMSMGKKTISPADVFKALDDVEFGFLKERLEAEYNKFNQIQTEKRTSYRAKVKAAKSGPNDSAAASTPGQDADVSMADSTAAGSAEGEEGHKSKKARVDPDATVNTVEHDDAETEDEEPQHEDDDNENDQDDDVEEDEGEGESGDDTQEDRLEDRVRADERDEALDGDDSD